MRIDKFLANSGVGSRSEVRKIIKQKKIYVNDVLVKDTSFNVDEKNDIVLFENRVVKYKPYVYIMLNKPNGVVSATFDKKLKTVIDILNGDYKTYELFPIGRLDIDTVGLLILTNDGKLAHNLLSPKKHIKKTYYVEYMNELSDEDKINLQKGVDIGGYITKRDAIIEILSSNSCYLTISEGKFHQIKKMFNAVGNKVTYLKRVKMNNLVLDTNLNEGEYRELSDSELKLLKE
ncbi:pseudouridine synthase [Sneathia vaginalis]|uniref:pseudouridine synthase n=1 Tax=Sneathia vaginalis TaxID=187101 RepID=UPI0035C6DD79